MNLRISSRLFSLLTSISRSCSVRTILPITLRKYGGFIPGIRPGRRTSDFINDVLTRITLVGAIYLIIISLIPTFADQWYPLQSHSADRGSV